LVHVEQEVVDALQLALPVVQAHEAVAKHDQAGDVVAADGGDGICGPIEDFVRVEAGHARLVHEAVQLDDVLVPRLSEECG